MEKMIVLGLPLDLGRPLQVHINIFKMQSSKWRIRSYEEMLLQVSNTSKLGERKGK
jgi:hypothetical protein